MKNGDTCVSEFRGDGMGNCDTACQWYKPTGGDCQFRVAAQADNEFTIEIERYVNDEFAIVDYGDHLELCDQSAGRWLTFTDTAALLRLAEFIRQCAEKLRPQTEEL